MDVAEFPGANKSRPLDPFRRAVVRGLAVLLPPLLTVVIFLWVGNTVADYLLNPLEGLARRYLLAHYNELIVAAEETPDETIPPNDDAPAPKADEPSPVREPLYRIGDGYFRRAANGQYMPADHYDNVYRQLGTLSMPQTPSEIYRLYVEWNFLQRHIVIPIFSCIFLLALYLLGKFLAAGVGRFFWMQLERIISRVPLVRNVYSSVKQISDFMFSEREIEYTRVVAVEYPRRGVWSLAMVTGESMLDIRCAANEPVLSVLIPSSPMPVTGYTITVKKSEVVDLNITIEQAFQFIVSCGVVVPAQQMSKALAERRPADQAGLSDSSYREE
ncbi:MAG: DUF502 domain-containing protein [Planctomycetales bacterium]|nr:DUF502 domain-containing protein [Planctomycetales bacterium]